MHTHICTDPCMYMSLSSGEPTLHTYVSPPVASCSKCAQNAFLLETGCSSLACSPQGPACWTFQPHQSTSANPCTNTTVKGTAIAGPYTQYSMCACVHVYTCVFTCCVDVVFTCVLCMFTCLHVRICAHYVHVYILPSHACACHYLFLQFGLLGFKDRDGLFEGC